MARGKAPSPNNSFYRINSNDVTGSGRLGSTLWASCHLTFENESFPVCQFNQSTRNYLAWTENLSRVRNLTLIEWWAFHSCCWTCHFKAAWRTRTSDKGWINRRGGVCRTHRLTRHLTLHLTSVSSLKHSNQLQSVLSQQEERKSSDTFLFSEFPLSLKSCGHQMQPQPMELQERLFDYSWEPQTQRLCFIVSAVRPGNPECQQALVRLQSTSEWLRTVWFAGKQSSAPRTHRSTQMALPVAVFSSAKAMFEHRFFSVPYKNQLIIYLRQPGPSDEHYFF